MRVLTIFILSLLTPNPALAAELKPQHFLDHIASVGPTKALSEYYGKGAWHLITSGIASGKIEWLKVYSALAPAADAGAGEELNDALFMALTIRPLRVIPILTSSGEYTVEQVCTFTFESDVPDGGINAYLTKLDRGLAQARTESEKKIAADCSRGVMTTRSMFKNSPSY